MTPPTDARPGETTACRWDTNGDGNCGRWYCPICYPVAPSRSPETPTHGEQMVRGFARKLDKLTAPLSPPAARGAEDIAANSNARAFSYSVSGYPRLECDECGAISYALGMIGQIHGCPKQGAWRLINQPPAAHPEPTLPPDAALREAAAAFMAMYDRYQRERGNLFWLPDQLDALSALRAALAQEEGR